MTDTQSADAQSADATEEAGYGQNPLSGMDPEMAANPTSSPRTWTPSTSRTIGR